MYCRKHVSGELVQQCRYVDSKGNINTCTNIKGVSKKSGYYCYPHYDNQVTHCQYESCNNVPRSKNMYCRKHINGELVQQCRYVNSKGNINTCTNINGVSKKSGYYCYSHVGNIEKRCQYESCNNVPRSKNMYCRKHI